MKKILSVVLACAMIFTMVLPMAVFAEGEVTISTAEAVTIEVDEHVVASNAAGFTRKNNVVGIDGYVISGNRARAADVTVASVDVTVANTGYYDLEYVATNYAVMASATLYSYVQFFLTPVVAEGETATAVKVASTEKQNVVERYTFSSATIPYAKFCDRAYIAAGNYTLTTVVTSRGNTVRGGIDYIKFAPATPNPETAPVISLASFKVGDNGVVTPSYTFTSPLGNADASVFTLNYDGEVIGSFKKGEEIVVPESVRTAPGYDKTKVVVEVIPIDAEENIGAVTKLPYVEMTASYAAGAVTTDLTVVKGSSNFNAVLLVAFYDTNEAGDKYLLKIEQKHIEVTTDVPYELLDWSASTTVSDEDYIGVVPESAEVILLGCTASTAEQKANPIFHTTLEEYACVGNITIG